MNLENKLILWIKYWKRSFDLNEAVRKSKPHSLWCWIQPGDYELWIMAGNDRYLITTYDQDAFDENDFIRFGNNKNLIKSWMKENGYSIGKRIGFSECVYNVTIGLKNHPEVPKMDNFKNHVWVGFELERLC